jgi:hypothetical protein
VVTFSFELFVNQEGLDDGVGREAEHVHEQKSNDDAFEASDDNWDDPVGGLAFI